MSRTLVFVCALAGVLAVGTGVAGAKLVAYYPFSEGTGNTVADVSGNGHNGTGTGLTWVDGPTGLGKGIFLSGANPNAAQYVNCGTWDPSEGTGQLTVALWARWDGPASGVYQGIVGKRDNWAANQVRWQLEISANSPYNLTANNFVQGVGGTSIVLEQGVWTYLTLTTDGTTGRIYVNAVEKASGPFPLGSPTGAQVEIGTDNPAGYNAFKGAIDDVRFYDEALAAGAIQALMTGDTTAAYKVSNPSPADKATNILRDGTVLSWTPGQAAATHNVYFGTSLDDVNAASASVLIKQGQPEATCNLGRLEFNTTYYWRVDEVNAPASSGLYKGYVWQFTTEPIAYAVEVNDITAKASSQKSTSEGPENTINGSGIVNDLSDTNSKAMWQSQSTKNGGIWPPAWIQYDFKKAFKLHEMWVWNYNGSNEADMGVGAMGVTIDYTPDGSKWISLGTFEFAQAIGADEYAHNTTVPFNGVAAQSVRLTINSNYGYKYNSGLSEVRFYYVPVWAKEPAPTTGKTGVDPTTLTLGWRPGRGVASHDVYLGTDPNALTKAQTVPTNSYTPTVDLGAKYYWRVDEVNQTNDPTTWASEVWNFATADFLPIDDMEGYNATDKAVFSTWVDGYNSTTNGSQAGYSQAANGTFCETAVIHAGKQAMPFLYGRDNITLSELTCTYTTPQNWTAAGAKTLTLWFSGAPENSAVSLYVKINDTKVTYAGEAGNLQRRRWNQWNIDLSALPAATVKAVSKVTLGVAGSGTGTLLIDDLRLYKAAPAIPTPTDPGTTGLVAYYQMNNNVQDSSGKGNNGTVVGAPTYAAGLSASNLALVLNGTADAVDLGKKDVFNPAGSFSISLWAKIGAWGTAWNHVLIGNRGEDNLGWQVRRGSGTGLCWTTRGTGGGVDDLTGGTPAQNEWVHVTCVYDQAGATKTLYINGVMSITGNTTAGNKMAATTHNTYIGARALAANTGPDTATFFTGSLDEIRIFDRALTGGEADFLSKP